MDTGASWVDRLDTALAQSVMGYFFSFLSHDWLRSRWALVEIERFLALKGAMQAGRPPFLVALDPMPSLLDLPEGLRGVEILDFSGGDVAEIKQKLLRAVGLLRGSSEPI